MKGNLRTILVAATPFAFIAIYCILERYLYRLFQHGILAPHRIWIFVWTLVFAFILQISHMRIIKPNRHIKIRPEMIVSTILLVVVFIMGYPLQYMYNYGMEIIVLVFIWTSALKIIDISD